MFSTYDIIKRILFVVLLIGSGILAKKLKLVSDASEKDLSLLSVDFIWPALIFSSIISTLNADDILSNLPLPLLSVFIHLIGFLIGFILCRLAGYNGERKKMFLFHTTMNNFLTMALPIILFFLPQKGTALLAVANLGSIIIMWTLAAGILTGSRSVRQTLRSVFSPAMLAIIAGVTIVLLDVGKFIPGVVMDCISEIGKPTLFLGLFIAGLRVYKLGRKALRFNGWNILVGFSRTILIPCILFASAFLFRDKVSSETLIIFLVVSITPANVTSVTLAMKFGSSADLAAEGVLITHLLSLGTMIMFIKLVERFFLV